MAFEIDFISLKGSFHSKYLERKVKFRLVAPSNYRNTQNTFKVLLMNDGQDYTAMKLEQILSDAFTSKSVAPFIYVGLECNADRMHEYGTAASADYKKRGSKASKYTKFVVEELIPFLKGEFKVSHQGVDWVYCGMSLGGLSAFDIAYNHPLFFGKIGVFSGSFWWRKKAYVKKDVEDRSRIILDVIKNGHASRHLKFWLQTGTEDETADRNNNGVIDAIDDTKDVIKALQARGYSYPGDITYVEIEGGKHNLPTWAKAFPGFIEWAFKKT